MKKPLRKILSMVLCVILVLSTLVPVFADTASNTDYDTHWAKAAITSAVASGITKGYPDGSFKPENLITRAEFFALVNNAFKLTETAPASYTDVAADAWYAPIIAKAKAAGYISGYADGSIHPESNITRQEAAVILSRAKALKAQNGTLTFSDATSLAAWGQEAVAAVSEAKIMKGYPDGSFKPEAQIKRAEALVAITACTAYTAPAVADASSKDTVYDKGGSYGSSTETVTVEGNVVIKASGVTLQNTVIKGNLTIAKEVGNGEVTLKSVVVKGNTYVNGGGVNSIYFINVTTGKVYVQRDDGPVRIVASGTSEIDELLAGSDVKLEEVNMTGAGFEGITVEKNAAGGVDITLAGVKCDSIDIKAPGVTLNADKASTISKLTVDAANTQLKGTGKIENAVINAGGVNFETKPTKTETAPGVTAPTVKPAPTAPTGGGGGGGGGSGTPANITVSAVTVTSGTATVVNGSTLQLSATVTPDTATNKSITWSVANGTGTATIDASTGLLTATSVGTVTVKATNIASGIIGSKIITVTPTEAVLQANAETAVAAYEAAPITTLAQVATAEGLKAAADTAVAKVGDAGAKAAFTTRVSTRTAAIASARTALEAAAETALQADAETAVAAYESAPITTLAQVSTAEGLKAAADTAVAAVGNAAAKSAFASRVTTRAAAIASARTALEAAAEAALQAAAETAVAAYESASIATLAQVATAEGLKAAADTAVAAVGNVAAKSAFEGRINSRTAAIATAKAALQEAALQADAETAVAAYESAPITTLAQVSTAEGLKAAADTAVAAVGNAAAKSAFASRVTTRAAAIASARTALEAAAEAALQAAAETAVAAYESASIATLAQVATAEGLKAAADTAVAAVGNVAAKSAFEGRINSRTAAIATAKAALQEAALQAAAETAVAAYEAAPITTLAQVSTAEGLKAAADTAVAAVGNAAAKSAFASRVTTRAAAIASARTALEATAEAALQATAETAVAAYESAPLATLVQVATAEGLKAAADTAVAAVGNAAAKAAFTGRMNSRTVAIAAERTKLEAVLLATASTKVDALELAANNDLRDVANLVAAEAALTEATAALAAVSDANPGKAALVDKFVNPKGWVTGKRADQTAVEDEAKRYEVTATVPNTRRQGDYLDDLIIRLKTGQTHEQGIYITKAVANGTYLAVDSNNFRLKAQKTTAGDATQNVVLTFNKNGQTATLTIAVTIKTTMPAPPPAPPTNPQFIDFDLTAGKISGSFFWELAVDESNVEGYKLYLLDESDTNKKLLNTIQKGTNSCTISNSIDVSNGYKLGIFAYNEGGEETTGAKLTILDRYPRFSGATWSYSDFLLKLNLQYTPTGSGFDLTKLTYSTQAMSTYGLKGIYTQVNSRAQVDGENRGKYYFDSFSEELYINLTVADYDVISKLGDCAITGEGGSTPDTVSAELGWCITSGGNAPAVEAKVVTVIF